MAKKLSKKRVVKRTKTRATKRKPKPVEQELEPVLEFGPPMDAVKVSKLSLLPRPDYEKMLIAIMSGATWGAAAYAIGIHPITFTTWLRKGKEGKKPYTYFLRDIIKAGSVARVDCELKVAAKEPLAWLRNSPMMKLIEGPEWGKNEQIVQVEGGENPVELAVNQVLRINDEDGAKALQVMEELGLIQLTQKGKQALLGEDIGEVIDVELDDDGHNSNGNGKP